MTVSFVRRLIVGALVVLGSFSSGIGTTAASALCTGSVPSSQIVNCGSCSNPISIQGYHCIDGYVSMDQALSELANATILTRVARGPLATVACQRCTYPMSGCTRSIGTLAGGPPTNISLTEESDGTWTLCFQLPPSTFAWVACTECD